MNELVSYQNDEFRAWIEPVDDGFELCWTDYVANEWVERYDSLAVAVARLSALIRCSELRFEVGFTSGREEVFVDAATRFYDEILS